MNEETETEGGLTVIVGADETPKVLSSDYDLPITDKGMPNLRDWVNATPKILIARRQGGIGDILNSRMLFEDIKKMAGEIPVYYAVPQKYLPLIADHPFIDGAIDVNSVINDDYSFRKDITDKCGIYESAHIPAVDKHRSDIWADYIGLTLTSHNSHISFTDAEIRRAGATIAGGLNIAIMPISAHRSKDWEINKWRKLVNAIHKETDCRIWGFHTAPLGINGVNDLIHLPLRDLMALVNQCDMIITGATSLFCLGNALHKPAVAIFGCEDLDIYGKYYPEMVGIQRHRRQGGKWLACPCWQAWKGCKIATGSSRCKGLKNITPDEVMKGFGECLKKVKR